MGGKKSQGTMGMIKGNLYNLQQEVLYGAVNFESKGSLRKALGREIDRFFEKLLRSLSGISKKSPCKDIRKIYILPDAQERT